MVKGEGDRVRAGLISGDPGFQKWAVKKEDAWADSHV